MAQAPSGGGGTTANPDAGMPHNAPGLGGLVEKAEKTRMMYAIGVGGLVAGAGYFMLSKRMGKKAILVGLVLGVVAYLGANQLLPRATAQNYGN